MGQKTSQKIFSNTYSKQSIAQMVINDKSIILKSGNNSSIMIGEDGVSIACGTPSKFGVTSMGTNYAGFLKTTPFPFSLFASILSAPQQIIQIPFADAIQDFAMASAAAASTLASPI